MVILQNNKLGLHTIVTLGNMISKITMMVTIMVAVYTVVPQVTLAQRDAVEVEQPPSSFDDTTQYEVLDADLTVASIYTVANIVYNNIVTINPHRSIDIAA